MQLEQPYCSGSERGKIRRVEETEGDDNRQGNVDGRLADSFFDTCWYYFPGRRDMCVFRGIYDYINTLVY